MTSKLKLDVLETGSGSGTIALNNQLSGMTAASVPALTSAHMPAGSIIQVQSRSTGTVTTSTSTSWVDTDVYVDITPQFSNSRIVIIMSSQYRTYGWATYRLSRRDNSNTILANIIGIGGEHSLGGGQTAEQRSTLTVTQIDSPATTSALKYRMAIKKYNQTTPFNLPESGFHANITVMEVAV